MILFLLWDFRVSGDKIKTKLDPFSQQWPCTQGWGARVKTSAWPFQVGSFGLTLSKHCLSGSLLDQAAWDVLGYSYLRKHNTFHIVLHLSLKLMGNHPIKTSEAECIKPQYEFKKMKTAHGRHLKPSFMK